jgi:hypothetical protein
VDQAKKDAKDQLLKMVKWVVDENYTVEMKIADEWTRDGNKPHGKVSADFGREVVAAQAALTKYHANSAGGGVQQALVNLEGVEIEGGKVSVKIDAGWDSGGQRATSVRVLVVARVKTDLSAQMQREWNLDKRANQLNGKKK